jgi:hypothetical protein
MSTSQPADSTQPAAPAAPPPEETHHGPWRWISIVLAIAVVGLLIWGLRTNSDLNGAQDDNAALKSFSASAKSAYDDVSEQLGATSSDLAESEQQVDEAKADASQAEKDAAAAKEAAAKAESDQAKADAEAEQARADAEAADSKAKIAAGCAKAYVSAFGGLFEGDESSGGAEKAGQELEAVTADCKAALSGD